MILELVPPLPLAHGGPGATWQALVTTIAVGLVIVFLLVVAQRLTVDSLGDLVLPLALVAILASIAPAASATLSDWVGHAVPVGLVVLLGLVLGAGTELELRWNSPLTVAVVVLSVAGSLALGDALNRTWHPVIETLPLADDAALTIVEPDDEATVRGGDLTVVVEVSGATVGPADLEPSDAPDDPEELGQLRLFVDGQLQLVTPEEDCTAESPCTTVTFEVTGVEPGVHTLLVDFARWDGLPLAPSVFARASITVE